MDDAALEAIYRRRIRPILFDGTTADILPVAALVGGQPGSGKTRAMVTVRGLNPGRSFVPIVGDDLRGMHPEYDRLVDVDPMRMPEVTAEASGRWVEAAIEDARSLRRSTMVEGTFRRPGVTVDTASNFRSAGFDVHLVALAVPDWESRLAILDRYVVDHASGRQARWTAPEAHDAGYAGMVPTVEAAIEEGVIDRVTVLDRQGRTMHDSRTPNAVAAVAAIERGRARSPLPGESEAFSARYSALLGYLEQTNQLDERTLPLVSALRDDRDLLGAMEARRIAGTGVPPQAGRGAEVSGTAPTAAHSRGHLRLVDKDVDVER